MSNLRDQIADSKKTIRKNKKTSPWIYVEYIKMNSAKYELEQAKEKYNRAKNAWRELGK